MFLVINPPTQLLAFSRAVTSCMLTTTKSTVTIMQHE
jgi:hypothetical protein